MKLIVGIDEVGRGPLAGPVVIAAILAPRNFQLSISKFSKKHKIKLRDSKKLSEKQREKWMFWVKENKIAYATSSVYPKIIDRINISNAANLAAKRAFLKVYKLISHKSASSKNQRIDVYLDGGLYVKISPKKLTNLSEAKLINFKTIVKGDEKIPAIALASIVAKVKRDKAMKILHKKYPQYGFDIHKGYGTKIHIQALKKRGISEIHRKSFVKSFIKNIK